LDAVVWLLDAAFSTTTYQLSGLAAPILLWQARKKCATVARHGREVVNWRISFLCVAIVPNLLLVHALRYNAILWGLLGVAVALVVGLAGVIVPITGAFKASRGELYSYPCVFRIVPALSSAEGEVFRPATAPASSINPPRRGEEQDLPLALRFGNFLNGIPQRTGIAEQRSALLEDQDSVTSDDQGSAPSIMPSTLHGQKLPLALRLGHFLNGTPPRTRSDEHRSALLAEACGTREPPVVAVAELAWDHASSGADLDNADDEVLVIGKRV
jgi:uncharacterized Tic20 family protein